MDATDRQAIEALGADNYDAALCNMALMDIAEIDSLMAAIAVALRPGGRFIFSILHPCFNNPSVVLTGELEDRGGTFVSARAKDIVGIFGGSTGSVGKLVILRPAPP